MHHCMSVQKNITLNFILFIAFVFWKEKWGLILSKGKTVVKKTIKNGMPKEMIALRSFYNNCILCLFFQRKKIKCAWKLQWIQNQRMVYAIISDHI